MHMASAWEVVVAANHGYGYLPRCVAYTDCKAGMNCYPGYSPDSMYPAVGQVVEVVGVADAKLGFWLKTESNYPCLLSRTVAERLQYVPESGPCMAPAAKRSPRILSAILLNYPGAFGAAKAVVRC